MDKPRFEAEKDVRGEVREAFPNAQWVEAALGGSTGLMDCFINDCDGIGSRVAFFELKTGEVKGAELRFTVRPQQRKRHRAMLLAGYCCWFLVGEKWGDRLWKVWPSATARRGVAPVEGPGTVRIFDLRAELLAGSFNKVDLSRVDDWDPRKLVGVEGGESG